MRTRILGGCGCGSFQMLLTFTTATTAAGLLMATPPPLPPRPATKSSHNWFRKGTQRIAYEVAVPATETGLVEPVILLNGFG